MRLTPEQEALILQCSKDSDAYQQLLDLFETITSRDSFDQAHLLRAVIDAIPDRIYVKDRDSRFVLANRATWQHHEMPDEQGLLGKTDIDLFGEIGRAYVESEQQLLQTGEAIINLEHRLPNRHTWSERPYTFISKVPLHDEDDSLIGLIGINRDITDLKRVEEELRQNQLFSVQVTLAIPDVIWVHDLVERAIIYCNEQAFSLLGYTATAIQEMGTQFLKSHIHPDDWTRALDHGKAYSRAQDGDVLEFECRMRHADGSWRWLFNREMIFKRNPDGSPRQLLGISHDVTRRKQAEEALRESEAQKIALINAIPDLIAEVNADGVVLNMKFRAGIDSPFPAYHWIGQTLHEIYPTQLADGMLMLVRRALATGQPQVWEYESPFSQDSSLREGRFVVINSERVMIISRDITETRKMEQTLMDREKLRIALQKEQELSLLKSRMMTRISHEFRTPLSVILTSSELVWHYGGRMLPEQRQEHFERIRNEIQNMSEILKSIAFIVQAQPRQRVLPTEACDLKEMCREMVEQIRSSGGAQHRLEVTADGDVRQFPADESILHRMIHHLLLNAVRYSPIETTVCIELYRRNEYITLRVVDHGIGIPEIDQPRIFEPFYRGSNVGEVSGMGLGLAVVKHGVELHDGAIVVESAVGEGTTITIQLRTSA